MMGTTTTTNPDSTRVQRAPMTRAERKKRTEDLRLYRLAFALGMPAQVSRNPYRSVAMGRSVIGQIMSRARRRK